MQKSEIEGKAAFDYIRYAQLWEDADVLTQGLGDCTGDTLVSICAAGDNALAMLTLDPKRVIVVDLSPAQISCLKLRMGAYRNLSHPEFLELTGSRPSSRRAELLENALQDIDADTRDFWMRLVAEVEKHGAGGVGKFERYFRIFRTYMLPLVHSRKTIDDLFISRSKPERQKFFDNRLNTFRWRLMLSVFFSRFVMGRMGRDKAFFDHVDGSPAQHVIGRVGHAAVDCDPAKNPYLYWIMKGTHSAPLPLPWREVHFETIKSRLNRIEIHPGSLEAFLSTGEKADGFNLSDIFEYMSLEVFETVYETIVDASAPNARLVYWNMMAPRRVPDAMKARVKTLTDLENTLKAQDNAFFYSDFIVEEVIG